MENEMARGAKHVLTHGTARTRAKADGDGGGDGDGAEHAAADGKKKIAEMSVRPAKNGGHVVRHKHHPPHHLPEHDEEYALPDTEALHDHIEEHLGQPNPGEEAEAAREEMAGGGAGGGGTAGAGGA